MSPPTDPRSPGSWTASEPHNWSRNQALAGLGAVALLMLAGLWALEPFLSALGWGAIFAVSLWPIYARALARWPSLGRLVLPAAFTLFILMAFVIPLAMVGLAVIHDSSNMAQWLATARTQGVPAPDMLRHLPFADHVIGWWDATFSTPEAISRLSHNAAAMRLGTGEKILGRLAHQLLKVFFMLLTLFFLLRDGHSVAHALEVGTRRGFGLAGERVAQQAVTAIRGTVNGLVIVGFGEGVILGLAYALAGASHPALLGLLTALLSPIPFGATIAVFAAGGLLAAGGMIVPAVIVLAVGFAVVFVADHFVRPAFIGKATRLPFLWVLLGILGGVEAWGLIGLVLGPAVIAVLMLLWREWVGAEQGPLNPASV